MEGRVRGTGDRTSRREFDDGSTMMVVRRRIDGGSMRAAQTVRVERQCEESVSRGRLKRCCQVA